MGKYEDITQSFYDDYEQPVIEEYIVGFSGLDPDRKIKPEEIDHEKLDGLLGGDFSGRYHLTNEQVRKFIGYQEQIDRNKEASETAITTLSTETSSALSSLRDETHQAISDLREDSETSDSEIRETTQKTIRELREYGEEAVRGLRDYTDEEIHKLNMDFNTAKSEMTLKVAEISGLQEVLEETQSNISARFDEALEGVTEDSEVIDARVDAENTRHVNLGANIRSLHRQILTADQTAHERDEGIYSHFQEQVDDISGELSHCKLEVDANKKRLSTAEAEISLADERLTEEIQTRQADTASRERAEAALHEEISSETETRSREDDEIRQEFREGISNARKETASRSEYLQEQAGTLAGEVLRLELQRQEDNTQHGKDIEALQLDIAKSRKISELGQEHIQKQSDDLAGAVLDNAVQIYELDNRLRDEIENRKGEIAKEARERLLSDQALKEELSSEISASREETSASYEHLQEQADELAGEILRQNLQRISDRQETERERQREALKREEQRDFQGEQINETAYGVLNNARNLAQEGNERRKLAASLREQISDWESKRNEAEKRMREGLSAVSEIATEAANDNAAAILRIALQVVQNAREQESYQEAIQEELRSRNNRISEWISGLQEQINELAYLKLSDLKAGYELDGRLSVIEGEIGEIQSEIDPTDTATDDEADEAIEDALSGEGILAETEPEFNEMLDDIFGVNP